MSKINSMMDIGRRSMQNSTSALQTVSHNIANKNTEGYSRQRVDFQTNEAVGHGKLRYGMGARPGTVARVNNSYIEKQIQREGSDLGYAEAKSEAMARVEQVYNEQVNKGLNKYMGEFFNSFRELSNNPESLSARTLVKESADLLTKDFKRVNKQLNDVQNDVDVQLAALAEEVNHITKEVANLNEKIQVVQLQGGAANDERDRRDLLVKKLGEKINIKFAENKEGSLTITAGSSAVLVSGFSQRNISVGSSPEKGDKRQGNYDVFYHPSEKADPVAITQQIRGGRMGALIEVRDKVVNRLHDEIDSMAFELSSEVNEAHQIGYDRYSNKGRTFFDNLDAVRGASHSLKLSQHIHRDVGSIVSAAEPNSPGDNRVANVLSSLQYKNVMAGGESTFDEYYNSIVGQVGIEAAKSNNERESQADIIKQLTNIRESISGVSLDEETAKMVEFQKAFDASARLIKTADEMLDTVLALKRI